MTNKTTPQNILKNFFGYDHFLEHQEDIIQDVLNGKDALVLMSTGGGKSICFQIPAMLLPGVGIVVSPLIALMQDQVDALKQLGVRADFINSTLSMNAVRAVEQKMLSHKIDLLYVAPERVMMPDFLNTLKRADIALFAIDEAHCVSQWGHDFRPEYLELSMLPEEFPDVPRIALTATADSVTRNEIVKKLRLENAGKYISSFDRPNISYRVVLKQNPKKQLDNFLKTEYPGASGIVYCLTRKSVETTADWLVDRGYTALPYHAGMDGDLRLKHQRRFLNEEGVIIVATIAFGMGIDKPDVRFVVHMDLPKSLESYYQETGRAGRDGQKSDALLIYGLSDIVSMRKILEGSSGNDEFKRIQLQRFQAMMGYCEVPDCRRQVLLNYFGESYKRPCGNCDNCNLPVDTWDGTIAAQKALSCVYRTGERFGAAYLTDVLLGRETQRIINFGHHGVSTFGIGTELNELEWKSVFRQLLAAGYLYAEMDSYGGYRLAEKSRLVLKKKQKVLFRKDPFPEVKTRVHKIKSEAVTALETDGDKELFEKLRSLRAKIAKEKELPAFVIFHDRTLYEIVNHLPGSLADMQKIHGIGESKLKNYGWQFLDAVLTHIEEHGDSGK